jgi:DNA-binding winged helix-turn-helix (wHTH) protein/HAMP domain-containing protein
VTGLEIGADDYITKPFSVRALVARVRALLRRTRGEVKAPGIVRVGGLEIDSEKYSVIQRHSNQIHPERIQAALSARQPPGQTFTREQLLDDLHGAASSVDRSVDSHIKNLRKKLEAASGESMIETVYGIGYRFNVSTLSMAKGLSSMSENPSPSKKRRNRFVPFAIFFIITAFIFVGGIAAILYLLFSQYTNIRNIWILVCGAPVVLVVFVLLTIFNLYTRYGRPLEELFNAINKVEEGDLSVRVAEKNSDMFSDLFKRFNKMVGELERAEQQRRNLTADIAHELRTPLHIIQGNLEGVLDGVYQPTPNTSTTRWTRPDCSPAS